MNIRDVHEWLAENLLTVAITEPVVKRIAKVWKFIPPARVKLTDLPAATLVYDLVDTTILPDAGSVRQTYNIQLDLFVTKAEVDSDKGADQASAFMDALVSFFSAHVRLQGKVQLIQSLRGTQSTGGTLARLTHGGSDYIGLSLILPILIQDVRTRGA